MGDLLSTLSQPNSSSSAAADDDIVAVRSNSTKPNQAESTQQRQSPESTALIDETSDPPTDAKTAGIDGNLEESKTSAENRSEESVDGGDGGAEEEGEEEEEAGECGFCLFMKGGGCKEAFIEWENCIEEAEKKKEDVVEKCYTVTSALKKCMEANSDYYAPILQAEKSMEEEAAKKLEEEKEKLNNEGGDSTEKEKEGALVGNDSKKQS